MSAPTRPDLTIEVIVEDCQWLADADVGLLEAARRVGMTAGALEKRLVRADRLDLVRRLRAHDPLPVDGAPRTVPITRLAPGLTPVPDWAAAAHRNLLDLDHRRTA